MHMVALVSHEPSASELAKNTKSSRVREKDIFRDSSQVVVFHRVPKYCFFLLVLSCVALLFCYSRVVLVVFILLVLFEVF